LELQRLRDNAYAKLRDAEAAWHAYFAALPLGGDRIWAAEVFERVRRAPARHLL
jgi:hypothetical protein